MKLLRTKRSRKLLIRLLVALIIVGLGYYTESNPSLSNKITDLSPGTYIVTNFNDGDTITVEMDGRKETIRFIGIDTPETQDPRKVVQCFGKAASDFTKALIGDQAVRLEADPLSSNRDRYNRLLRYVYLPDGRLAQAEILKEGYGFAYTSFPFTKSEEFLNHQRDARIQNKGLWSKCAPTTNEFGGFTSPPAD
ncbi:thermonuclease family protein [Candidatus Saccharibacteria bacterium]|nr:thermonuclease family protein [Candidatus Saccharibacteria bacterium]